MDKKICLIFLFLFWVGVSLSQPNLNPKIEVGVIEHLGETIPLNLVFNNEEDKNIPLSSLITKPTVLSLVYFDCPGICSPLQEGIADVIDKAQLELGKDYQVITISFNYQDTPEKARKKKVNFVNKISKEKSKNWFYLTGDSANINSIMEATGFRAKKVGMDWVHPGVLIILSPEGKITRYLYGLSYLPFDFKLAIIEAQKGYARPSINKVLDYCFSYDPSGRKYKLDVTRISATIIIFFALSFFTYMMIKYNRKNKKKEKNSQIESQN